MNQTGLSQSMHPKVTSDLLSAPKTEEEWLRLTLPYYPSSVKFFNRNKIPYVFAVSPLKANPESVKCPPKSVIPRCQSCNALPSKYINVNSSKWTCALCEQENEIKHSTFLPRFEEYDISLGIEKEKPLFLFILQSTHFLANEDTKKAIGENLDAWAQSSKSYVALVTLNTNYTAFDLSKPTSQVLIEPENIHIPICSSQEANFEKALNTLSPSTFSKELIFEQLKFITSSIHLKCVCVCLFADQIKEPEEFDPEFAEILSSRRFSFHLFSEKKADCAKFAKFCDRVRLFDEECAHLIAPELSKFLNSGILFRSQIYFYSPPSFELLQISSRRNVTSSKLTLTVLDGQMSLMPQYKMKYSPQKSFISFQITIDAVYPNGNHIIRVLNFITRPVTNVEKFDGVAFGCFIARMIAVEAYFESIEAAYKKYHDECITLITAWSDEGNYRRAILSIFRDVPLLLYAIQNCDLFRRGSTGTEINAMMINLMSSTVEEMRRMLYPMMLLPPLNFPHRLQMSSIGQFKLVVFLRAYDGVAVVFDDKPHTEEIEAISQKYKLPITLYTDEKYAHQLVLEDNSISFSQFTEKLEVEVNGRRF